MRNLFGEELPEPKPVPVGKRKPTKARGYGGIPGKGPAGENCKGCEHYTGRRNGDGRGRVHRKCLLNQAAWTHGPGSDIKAGSPACEKWEKAT